MQSLIAWILLQPMDIVINSDQLVKTTLTSGLIGKLHWSFQKGRDEFMINLSRPLVAS